ncbi:hypothetical protein LCGC14_2276490 [marine sediment metagenome]|uniref:Uncharacterized protein n=1 Tax=marine sediment metagenome TaxID=412755 RepID=A0A0F9FQN8_9ZZZZ
MKANEMDNTDHINIYNADSNGRPGRDRSIQTKRSI